MMHGISMLMEVAGFGQYADVAGVASMGLPRAVVILLLVGWSVAA